MRLELKTFSTPVAREGSSEWSGVNLARTATAVHSRIQRIAESLGVLVVTLLFNLILDTRRGMFGRYCSLEHCLLIFDLGAVVRTGDNFLASSHVCNRLANKKQISKQLHFLQHSL